jgi:DNA-binding CsgD family transcriptional regulator
VGAVRDSLNGRAAREASVARLSQQLVELGSGGLDPNALRRGADAILRRAVPYEVGAWATVDPASLVFTSCVVCGAETGAEFQRYVFENEWLHEDVNKFSALATGSRRHVAVLSHVTGGHPERSRRFRELLAPAGAGDELRAALVADGLCWGTLVACRMAGQPVFSARDADMIAAVIPVLAQTLRLSLLRRAAEQPVSVPVGPGVVLLDDRGEEASATASAHALLAHAAAPDQVPAAMRALHAASRAERDGATELVRSRLPTDDGGWLVLHSSRAGDRVAVVVERARSPELADIIVRAYGFTPREREVLALVMQGMSNKRIALLLGISAYTVADHLRAAFAKAGVTSRGELAALLNDRHYQPHVQAGGVPGPYGWFIA